MATPCVPTSNNDASVKFCRLPTQILLGKNLSLYIYLVKTQCRYIEGGMCGDVWRLIHQLLAHGYISVCVCAHESKVHSNC